MLKFLKSLFSSKKKPVREDQIIFTPASVFEFRAFNLINEGTKNVWRQTHELGELTEEIENLMSIRQKRVLDRYNLVTAINKQRKVLGLDEIDEEGLCLTETTPPVEESAMEQ